MPNKKYVDDSIANGDVNSAKYLNITNFIPSNSDFNDYKTPGEYQVQSDIEANTIANLPTSYNDATPRGGVLSVLIGFNASRTSLVQIYRTYGSSYVVSRTYQRCFYHENSSWTAWREIACTDEVGLLNQANTYTALNIFRASIGVSNGTAAGSSGTVSFGVSPTGETVQARIGTDNLGGLFYHASTNQPHVFRAGTNNNVFVIRDDDTKVAFSSNDNLFATVTHDGVAKWLGNANTATKLETARTINGVAFDGTEDIIIADIDGIKTDLTEKITTVANNLATHEADFSNPHKVTAEQLGLSNAYKYKGSVPTYQDLPSTAESGDVYNVVKGDKEIGVADGANFAWNGSEWDNLGGLLTGTGAIRVEFMVISWQEDTSTGLYKLPLNIFEQVDSVGVLSVEAIENDQRHSVLLDTIGNDLISMNAFDGAIYYTTFREVS